VEEIKANGARLVPLDTAADLFGGNENDRSQVRRFIGLLNYLAIEIDGAVLLTNIPT
jgi:RecA-family ATPase